MGTETKIAWCDSTYNPVYGCTRVSPACDNCYAAAWAARSGLVEWDTNERRRATSSTLRQVHRWQKQAPAFYAAHGRKRRVFGPSLGDPFDNKWRPEWRQKYFEDIKACPDLIFMLLSKRPQLILRQVPGDFPEAYPNLWLGVTIENREEGLRRGAAMARIAEAGRRPARIFWSCEPLLEELGELAAFGIEHCDWIIAGAESGPGSRRARDSWFRSIAEQCCEHDVSFFMKQISSPQARSGVFSELDHFPLDLQIRDWPDERV